MAARKKRSSTGGVRTRTVCRTKRRSYRAKSGIDKIPAAAATAGVMLANTNALQTVASDLSLNGVKSAAQQAIQPDQLKKDIQYGAIGLIAGCAIKRFAPRGIKSALGKVAKKMPRVF